MLKRIKKSLAENLVQLTAAIEADPGSAELYSRRGTVYFFLGEFGSALADFDREVKLAPGRLPSHWRRGIALYYAGRYEESAQQFSQYHAQDEYGDRENGIWNFLANAERLGIDEARERMLVYKVADRRPVMNDIYEVFAGKKTADELLSGIESRQLNATEHQQALFYAHLYLGWLAVAEKNLDQARVSLCKALANDWGRNAGGGPGYMWHTARVHYDLLTQ